MLALVYKLIYSILAYKRLKPIKIATPSQIRKKGTYLSKRTGGLMQVKHFSPNSAFVITKTGGFNVPLSVFDKYYEYVITKGDK